MKEFRTTEYDGIRLSEYNGTYSIEALRAKDDNFYQVWAKYKKNKEEYQVKDWPIKVILGNKEQAKTTLLKLIAELGENNQVDNQSDIPLSDVPF